MGTSLYSIANHKIVFKNRSYHDIAEEIRLKLNALELRSNPFLIHHTKWLAYYYNWQKSENEIFKKKYWSYNEEADLINYDSYKCIEMQGPFDLNIDFRKNSIMLWEPPFCYANWFNPDINDIRNEWRKYLYTVIAAFGGNRVIYMADNNHILSKYLFHKDSFKKMENRMALRLGKPKKNFEEVFQDIENAYLIDTFEDIENISPIDFNKILPLNGERYSKQSSHFFK